MGDVTKELIADGLVRLGLRQGDSVFVHSSLSSFGHVAGGADTVIDALLQAVGPEGNVALPTFTFSIDDGSPPYHPLKTPSRVGRITETFRLRRGVLRSLSPTHSVAAIGPAARRITAGHVPGESPFGRTTPSGSFSIWRKVVFLGCGLRPNSTLHAVETWAELPYMPERTRDALMLDDDGHITRLTFPCEPAGHRSADSIRSKVERAFDQAAIIADAQIGGASAQLIAMKEMVRVTLSRLAEDPCFLLCDSPVCEFCRVSKAKVLESRQSVVERIRRLKVELAL